MRRQNTNPGGTQLLHGACVHRKSKEISWMGTEIEWLPLRIYLSLKALVTLSPSASVCANIQNLGNLELCLE